MVMDLSALFAADGVKHFDVRFDLSDVSFFGNSPFKTVSAVGEITGRSGVVEMVGTADFDYTRKCDRCAKEVTRHFSVPVRHTLVTDCSDEASSGYTVIGDMKLDVDEVVREDVLLSVPGRYLCREDCKGLCSRCGKDLNEGACSCKKDETDPRLAALAELLD